METYQEWKKRRTEEGTIGQRTTAPNSSWSSKKRTETGAETYTAWKERRATEGTLPDYKRRLFENTAYNRQNQLFDYLDRASAFYRSAKDDFDSTTWGNAADTFKTRRTDALNLRDEGLQLQRWMQENKDYLDPETYDQVYSYLVDINDGYMDVVSSFRSNADFYGQFDTEEDYLRWEPYSTTEKRQATYQQNLERLDELTKRRDELKPSEDQPGNPYTTGGGPARTGMPYGAGNLYLNQVAEPGPAKTRDSSAADTPYGAMLQYREEEQKTPEQLELEEIEREIARLQLDINNYERGNTYDGIYYGSKVVDDYSAYLSDPNYGKYSASDFSNPTTEDLEYYDAMMDQSTWYQDGSGKTYNRLGELVTENVYSDDPRYRIADPLGMYLQATPEERANLHGDGSSQIGVLNKLYRDGTYGNWEKLTQDEVGIYYTILGSQGQDAAMKYLSDMQVELNRRGMYAEDELYKKAFDAANGWQRLGMSALSVPANLFGGAAGFIDDLSHTIKGEEINPYSAAHGLGNYSQQIRQHQAAAFDESSSWEIPWIKFSAGDLYQAVMSTADMAGGAILGPTTYGALMGMGAATSEARRLYEMGASSEQIALGAGLAGAAEMVFERYSMDKLIHLKDVDELGKVITNALIQGGIEASEEGATEIANLLTNNIIMTSESDWAKLLEEHNGSEYQAFIAAAGRVGSASMAGFVAGFLGGGGGSIASYTNNYYNDAKTGQAINDAEGMEKLREIANDQAKKRSELAQKDRTAKQEQRDLNRWSENANKKHKHFDELRRNRATGMLYKAVQQSVDSDNVADIASALQEQGISEKKAKALAQAFYAQATEQGVTPRQSQLIREYGENPVVQKVIADTLFDTKSPIYQRNRALREFEFDVMTNQIRQGSAESTEQTGETVENTADEIDGLESSYAVSEDGQTHLISDPSKTVNVKGFDSIQDGKVMLRTDTGETVEASDVSFGSKSEALVYEAVSNLSYVEPAIANKMVPHLKKLGGFENQNYAVAVAQAYNYGLRGYPLQATAGADTLSSQLSEPLRNSAWGYGRNQRKARADAQQAERSKHNTEENRAALKKKAPSNTKYKKVVFEGDVRLNEKRNTEIEFIDYIASEFSGNRVHIYESYKDSDGKIVYKGSDGKVHKAPNGMYVNNEIWLDLNAGDMGEGLILNTFGHELYHHIEKWSPKKAQLLAEFLVKELGFESVEAAVQNQIDKAERNGHGVAHFMEQGHTQQQAEQIVRDRAMSDFVADSLETMFTRGDITAELARLRQTDKGLFNEIRKFIGKWINKIKEFYSSRTITQEGDIVAHLESFEKIQRMFAEALVDAGDNYRTTMEVNGVDVVNGQEMTNESDTKYSNKSYGGIREVLAKKGLDEMSKRYGKRFPLSASFDATMKEDNTPLVMETVAAKSVRGKGSPFVVGRKAFIAAYGTKTSVHIKQMGINADLYANVANESISKVVGHTNVQSTLDVIPHISKVLENSILLGVERIAHTGNKGTALYGYRLYNLYWYDDGKAKTPHALVCTVVQDVNKAEGYVFQNIENVTIDRGLPGTTTGMSSSVNDDTYTVAQLYRTVKKIDRFDGGLKYTDDARAKYLFSYTEHDDGVKYSDRDTESVSNRSLLANAFEAVAQNDMERQKIQEYRENIEKKEAEEQKLRELREEIRKLSFARGPRDKQRLSALREEAQKAENRLNIYDKRLLRLEASKPLMDVLEREKQKAYSRAQQKGRERVAEVRDTRNKAEARKKIRRVIRELDKIFTRGDKKRNVKEGLRDVVASALASAEVLFTDTYTTDDMIRYGVGTVLTPEESQLLNDAVDILAELDNAPVALDFEAMIEWSKRESHLKQKLSEIKSKLKGVFERERIRLGSTTVSSILTDLADSYKKLSEAGESYIQGAYDEKVYQHLQNIKNGFDTERIADMQLDQLEALYGAYRMVLTTVRNANKMFAENIKEDRKALAIDAMLEVREAGGNKRKRTAVGKVANSFSWNNLKPVFAFERIGSNTMLKLYWNIRKGQDTWAVDMMEADEFRRSMYDKYHRKGWDMDKKYTFKSSTGLEFSLNLEQIMSLYAYSKRAQAHDHLLKGGIVFDGETKITEIKNGIRRTYLVDDATTYKISDETLADIVDTLNTDQKAFVDEMQNYLSTNMGNKGNQVSMKMYGIKLFKEQYYFPLRSAGQFTERAREADLQMEQGQISLANSGFTQSTAPNASNPVVLSGFMDVWSGHVNNMSNYHAFVLPLEDFRRVYNYKTANIEGQDSESVYQAIQNAHGTAATAYIDQLYRDLNGGVVGDPRENIAKKMIGLFKQGAVMASASVVIQQPSSIARAFAIIDPKYFGVLPITRGVGRLLTDKVHHQHQQLWEELKKFAPVAMIKEMGYFDTGMGRSAVDFLQTEEYHGFGEKAKGFKRDSDYRGEVLSKAAAKADELTWIQIWNAVKNETADRNPGMNRNSEEFLKIAGERFSEVIDRTQVYDSVFARSGNMRSKSVFMNIATAFMAEPTTSINMIEDAIRKYGKGYKGQAARTIGAVFLNVLLNSALVSLVYAARDDDEDETYLEKYVSSFVTESMDGLNPMTYYPFLKDVWSILQGYDVERADMSLVTDVVDVMKNLVKLHGKDTSDMDEEELAKHKKQIRDAWLKALDGMTAFMGLPVKNVRRDFNGAINMYKTLSADFGGRTTTIRSLGDVLQSDVSRTIPVLGWLPQEKKEDKLFDALVAGDTAYVERLKSTYKDEKAYQSAIRSVIGDRFVKGKIGADKASSYLVLHGGLDASQARGYIEKWTMEIDVGIVYDDLRKQFVDKKVTESEAVDYLVKYGGKREEDAEKAVREWGLERDTGIPYSKMKEVFLDKGISEDEAIEYMIEYGGKKRDAAEETVNKWQLELETGIVYDDMKTKFIDEDISESEAVDYMVEYGGKKQKDAEAIIKQWTFEKDTGIPYDDMKTAFLDEKISESEAVKYRVEYGGAKQKDAEKTVSLWKFEAENTWDYENRKSLYLDGEISAATLKKALIEFGDYDPEDAELQVQAYDWEAEGYEGVTTAAVRNYSEYCAAANVPKDIYMDIRKFANSTENDVVNGKKVPYSAVKKIMREINSQTGLTPAQKTAIARSIGWKDSTIQKYKLW